jgi:hypothetical protein
VAYLEKIVKLVGVQLNTIVDVRPSKIVAGLEPENTNRLVLPDLVTLPPDDQRLSSVDVQVPATARPGRQGASRLNRCRADGARAW